MKNISIAYNNLFDNSGAIAASSQAPGNFSVDLLQHDHLKITWRSNGLAASPGDYVSKDLGANPPAVNTFGLLNHNISSAANPLVLEGADNSTFTTNLITVPLTWSARHIFKIFSNTTRRHWKPRFLDPTNPDGFIEAGRMWLSTHVELVANYDLPFEEMFVDLTKISKSPGGDRQANILPMHRVFNFNFLSEQADRDTVRSIFRSVGIGKPIIIFFDYDNEPVEMTVYGYFTVGPNFSEIDFHIYGVGLGFEGVPE